MLAREVGNMGFFFFTPTTLYPMLDGVHFRELINPNFKKQSNHIILICALEFKVKRATKSEPV